MKRNTVYNTPVISGLFRVISRIALKVSGWRFEGQLPAKDKYVLIGAPHTSNWDFPFMLFFAFHLNKKFYWMGKDALFRFPFYHVMTWLGGIPIDRSQPHGVVAQTIEVFNQEENMIVVIPPEGTRSAVKRWKTGFYHIALGAKVPILTGYLDYPKKIGGYGPAFLPTGDVEKDIKEIQHFYAGITPKYPEKRVLPED